MIAKENFIFRRAKLEDITAVREMIVEFAAFHNVHGAPNLSVEDLICHAGLNGGTENMHLYLFELKNENKNKTTLGYAVCYTHWSTSAGKIFYLENFYMKSKYRKLGAGTHFLCEIAAAAKEMGYKSMSFDVSYWNPAKEFYKNRGATPIAIHLYRVKEDKIKELVEQLQNENKI